MHLKIRFSEPCFARLYGHIPFYCLITSLRLWLWSLRPSANLVTLGIDGPCGLRLVDAWRGVDEVRTGAEVRGAELGGVLRGGNVQSAGDVKLSSLFSFVSQPTSS